jgi:hypothetical protein
MVDTKDLKSFGRKPVPVRVRPSAPRYAFIVTMIHFALLFLSIVILPLKAVDYKILVLPSGGAAAIVSAVVLEQLEKQTKLPVHQLFHEIWGASAGALIGGLLTAPSSSCQRASDVVHFFERQFGSYYHAYRIRTEARIALGNARIQDTRIPLRILTAVSKDSNPYNWHLYDVSSDGKGSCSDTTLSLADVVAASCTVYPVPHYAPMSLREHGQSLYAIDPGCECCSMSTLDPSAYFLEQWLHHLHTDDTLTLFFVANAFTSSLDAEAMHEVLKNLCPTSSYAIRYDEGSFSLHRRRFIEIINIPVLTDCLTLVNRYLATATLIEKVRLKAVQLLFERIMDKQKAAAHVVGAGALSLVHLKEEGMKIVRESLNFKAMVQFLLTYS